MCKHFFTILCISENIEGVNFFFRKRQISMPMYSDIQIFRYSVFYLGVKKGKKNFIYIINYIYNLLFIYF